MVSRITVSRITVFFSNFQYWHLTLLSNYDWFAVKINLSSLWNWPQDRQRTKQDRQRTEKDKQKTEKDKQTNIPTKKKWPNRIKNWQLSEDKREVLKAAKLTDCTHAQIINTRGTPGEHLGVTWTDLTIIVPIETDQGKPPLGWICLVADDLTHAKSCVSCKHLLGP